MSPAIAPGPDERRERRDRAFAVLEETPRLDCDDALEPIDAGEEPALPRADPRFAEIRARKR